MASAQTDLNKDTKWYFKSLAAVFFVNHCEVISLAAQAICSYKTSLKDFPFINSIL